MTGKQSVLLQEVERVQTAYNVRMGKLITDIEDPSPWILLDIPPVASGKYLIGHRGHQAVMRYFAPNTKEQLCGITPGWQGNVSFNPTHWMYIPEINSVGKKSA